MADLLTTVEPPALLPGETNTTTAAKAVQVAVSEEKKSADDKFDWCTDDSVIINEQLAVACYKNRAGGIVIRQQTPCCDQEDNYIVLRDAEAVRILIAALKAEGGAR